jgi:hypothetical protein
MDRARASGAYSRPEVEESIAPLVGQPVWFLLSVTCYAHSWAHLEEIKMLAGVGRSGR